jgi:hypothetical protein
VRLGVGTHHLTASYQGNTAFSTSQSAAVSETVNRAATAVALSPSVNPTVAGRQVTFIATVTALGPGAGSPTGTMSFFDGSILLGTAAVVGGAKATLTWSFSAAGNHVIKAVYSGDGNFLAGSQTVTEMVLAPSTTALAVSENPVPAGPASFARPWSTRPRGGHNGRHRHSHGR